MFDVYKNRTDSMHKSFSLIPASVRAIFVNSWIKRLYCTSSSSTILNLNPRTVIPFSWVSASCTVSSWMFRWTKCNSSGYLATVIFVRNAGWDGNFLIHELNIEWKQIVPQRAGMEYSYIYEVYNSFMLLEIEVQT